ncbi:MAG: hypothetical protein FJY99_11565 [Candidatus Sericytochromatia bacterium]|nr:hypothetical protein [Candidatus Tanganyikabacteria bacterium]
MKPLKSLLIVALAVGATAASLVQTADAAGSRTEVRGTAERYDLTADELEKVNAGSIVTRHKREGSSNEFYAAGLIKAPVDKVFDYYRNHENTMRFQNSLKKIEPLILDDERTRYRQLKYTLSLPWPIGQRLFILDLKGDGKPGEWGDIWWSYNKGTIDGFRGQISEMKGSYVINAKGANLTLLRYHVETDLDTWLPGWLIGIIQGGTVPNVVSQGRKDLE